MQYYLFYPGYRVVKDDDDGMWYARDRKNHTWTLDNEWFDRFIGSSYDAIEIDYDEEREEILGRRRIQGWWSINDEMLLNPENDPATDLQHKERDNENGTTAG